nr:MAG TPA: hypothetical protein [Caudoviricetes sp.]
MIVQSGFLLAGFCTCMVDMTMQAMELYQSANMHSGG